MSRTWTLPAEHRSAGRARSIVSEALASWPSSDDAELVVSELVTNAVDHGEGPIQLQLDTDAEGVRIGVIGSSPSRDPAPRPAAAHDGRGRGLLLVASLADDWGWKRDADRVLVWAHVMAPTDGNVRSDAP